MATLPDDIAAPNDRPVIVDGATLTLEAVGHVARRSRPARLAAAVRPDLEASRSVIARIVETGAPVYGVTTGFGALSDRAIPPEASRQLQINLLRSHAAGAGEPFADEVVRAAMLLRANSLARGASGVRPVVVERLLDLLNAGIHPIVPSQGSLGASGDLAPLAHLALPLLGLGEVRVNGRRLTAADALQAASIAPLALEPKEALALINGTQFMAAVGALALLDAERVIAASISVAALSLCAIAARRSPFEAPVQAVRPHPGQVAVAAELRRLLRPVPEAVPDRARIQDPYSVRCIPQLHGAVRDAIRPLRVTLEIEINAATDNPLVFPGETEEVISGGNFHGHPLALGCDTAKIAIASLGTIVERRIALLVDGAEFGLPVCLAAEPGLNSGYMIAHYLAAGLVAENKILAHPASVDSLPTSAGIEDVNTMGAIAARHFREIVANVERIVAVEALGAAQACDLADRVPPGPLGALHARIRERVPRLERDDRVIANDIEAAVALLRAGGLVATPEPATGNEKGGSR